MVSYTNLADISDPAVRKHVLGIESAAEALWLGSPFTAPTLTYTSLHELCIRLHALNVLKGWWSDPATGQRKARNFGEMMMLEVSELGEGLEGIYRQPRETDTFITLRGVQWQADEHLPGLPNFVVELADFVIRICDMCEGEKIPFPEAALDLTAEDRDELNLGGHLSVESHVAWIVVHMTRAFESRRRAKAPSITAKHLLKAVLSVIGLCKLLELPLGVAIAEKTAYNQVRYDHMPAARLAEGGKLI